MLVVACPSGKMKQRQKHVFILGQPLRATGPFSLVARARSTVRDLIARWQDLRCLPATFRFGIIPLALRGTNAGFVTDQPFRSASARFVHVSGRRSVSEDSMQAVVTRGEVVAGQVGCEMARTFQLGAWVQDMDAAQLDILPHIHHQQRSEECRCHRCLVVSINPTWQPKCRSWPRHDYREEDFSTIGRLG